MSNNKEFFDLGYADGWLDGIHLAARRAENRCPRQCHKEQRDTYKDAYLLGHSRGWALRDHIDREQNQDKITDGVERINR